MKHSHTFGPWQVTQSADETVLTIDAPLPSDNSRRVGIARLANSLPRETVMANARLIACAPAMLDALLRLANDPETPDYVGNFIMPIIARATGGAE